MGLVGLVEDHKPWAAADTAFAVLVMFQNEAEEDMESAADQIEEVIPFGFVEVMDQIA